MGSKTIGVDLHEPGQATHRSSVGYEHDVVREERDARYGPSEREARLARAGLSECHDRAASRHGTRGVQGRLGSIRGQHGLRDPLLQLRQDVGERLEAMGPPRVPFGVDPQLEAVRCASYAEGDRSPGGCVIGEDERPEELGDRVHADPVPDRDGDRAPPIPKTDRSGRRIHNSWFGKSGDGPDPSAHLRISPAYLTRRRSALSSG